MASSQVDQAVFQRTRDTLGKIIKKPPLTDKLLARPPFRYIHDILSEISKLTSFFNGLYSSKEMDAKSIQDKEAKVAFLQKAVDTLSFTTGEVVKIKPSKTVAGQETDKTNEFLQILGISILKKLDSTEAIRRVLNGEKPSETLVKEKKRRGDKDASKDKSDAKKQSRSRSIDKPSEARQPSEERSQQAKGKPKETTGGSVTSLKSKSHRSLKDKQKEEDSHAAARPTHRPSRTRPPPDSEPQTSSSREQVEPDSDSESGNDEGLGSETKLERPISAKGSRKRQNATGSETSIEHKPPSDETESQKTRETGPANTSPPPPVQAMVPAQKRPGSARPAPPKIIRHGAAATDDPTNRVLSGHSTSSEPQIIPSVILDTPGGEDGGLDDDDDDQYVIQDTTPLEIPSTEVLLPHSINDKPEGVLTKNIVAMKERLEGDLNTDNRSIKSDYPSISEAHRRKEREIVTKEIETLQSSIQTLCKSANPLGKIMDYVQEDMDSMQKELEMWKAENEKHTELLRKEQSITEQELSPLRAQLEELENKVREQVDLISATKANIVGNDEKTRQILNSMAFVSS